MPKKKISRSSLRVENLETRAVPAVTVNLESLERQGGPAGLVRLVIESNAETDQIVVTRGGDGAVKLNGNDLPGGSLSADMIGSIVVANRGGGDTINLSGVDNTSFPGITSAFVPAFLEGFLLQSGLAENSLGAVALSSVVILDGVRLVRSGGPGAEIQTFSGVENAGGSTITGSNLISANPDPAKTDDAIFVSYAGPGGVTVQGGGGIDFIKVANSQNAASQELRGGDGDDLIEIFDSSIPTRAFGEAGDDFINVFGNSLTNHFLDGGSGKDQLQGSLGNDTLVGGSEDDTLLGQDGNDILFGDEGADSLEGGDGADILIGGGGDDTTDGAVNLGFTPDKTGDTLDPLEVGQGTGYFTEVTSANAVKKNGKVQEADFATDPRFTNTFLKPTIIAGFDLRHNLGVKITHPNTAEQFNVLAPGAKVTITDLPTGNGLSPGTGINRLKLFVEEDDTPDLEKNNDAINIDTKVIGPKPPVDGPPDPPKLITVVEETETGIGPKTPSDGGTLSAVSRNGQVVGESTSFDIFKTLAGKSLGSLSGGSHLFWGDPILVDEGPESGGFGVTGNGASFDPFISDDGRFVAFTSLATNLIAGGTDTNGSEDAFVRDMQTGAITLVSRNSSSVITTGDSFSTVRGISGNGRFVLFSSNATNLIAGLTDSNTNSDLFRFDRQTGETQLVSKADGANATGNNVSGNLFGQFNADISEDGRFVLFASRATNLVAGVSDTNNQADLFLRDMVNGTTVLVTKTPDGASAMNGSVSRASLSADGQIAAYQSSATNLTALTDGNGLDDIFVFRASSGQNEYVTVKRDGSAPSASIQNLGSFALSKDGSVVTFTANTPTDLFGNGPDNDFATNFTGKIRFVNVFARDLTTNVTDLLTMNAARTDTANGFAADVSISDDAKYVAFVSSATNMVNGITYAATSGSPNDQIFVVNRDNEAVTISSISSDSTKTSNGDAANPTISGDGSIVYFETLATDILPAADLDDDNDSADVFGSSAHSGGAGSGTVVGTGAAGLTRFRLKKNGDHVELVNETTGVVLVSKPAAELQEVVVVGRNGVADELIIDFGNGEFTIPGGVTFDGKTGADKLTLIGGTFDAVRHQLVNTGEGAVSIEGPLGTTGITYLGVESVVEQTAAPAKSVESAGVRNDVITLAAGGADTKVTASRLPALTLGNPATLLSVIGGEGNDSITANGLGTSFAATLELSGGAGNDTLNAAKSPVNVNVRLSDDIGNDTLTGHKGNTTFRLAGEGTDRVIDAGGLDTLDFSEASGGVNINLTAVARQTITPGGDLLTLTGIYENLAGSLFDDSVTVTPATNVPFTINGGDGGDSLTVRNLKKNATNIAGVVTVEGMAPVNHSNVERVSIGEPVGGADEFVLFEDTILAIPAKTGLLSNDINPDGDKQLFSVTVQPAHGLLTTKPDGSFVYKPTANFAGRDTFTYRVSDGALSTDTVVTLDVLEVNDLPTADIVGSLAVPSGTPQTFTLNAADVETTVFDFHIDWDGDGTIDQTVTGPTGTPVQHTFPADGAFHVSVEALDAANATSDFTRRFVKAGGLTGTPGSAELIGAKLVIVGTDNKDTISVTQTATGQLAVKINTTSFGPFAGADGLHIAGLDGNDVITVAAGLALPSTINGGAGNDTITAGPGNDLLLGGAGNDTLKPGGAPAGSTTSSNRVFADAGNDLVTAGTADDTIDGGGGNDRVDAGAGNDLLLGGAGNDTLLGGIGNDILHGGDGNDSQDGGTGNDIIVGGIGNDTALGAAGRDLLIGGFGRDSINGGADDDICITGLTAFDNDDTALNSILAEWTATKTYAERVTALRGPAGGLNGTNFLGVSTFSGDFLKENSLGGAGFDFLIGGLFDGDTSDRTGTETELKI